MMQQESRNGLRRRRRRPYEQAHEHRQHVERPLLRLLEAMSAPEASPLTASRRRRPPPAPMDRPPSSDSPPLVVEDDATEDGSGLLGIDGPFGHNSSDSSLFPTRGAGAPLVRAEEALIVLIVLVLWGAAIALFFNRWGKIRMLEPYQPKFQHEQHRASCPMLELTGPQHRTFSKFNLNACNGNEAVYASLVARNSSGGLVSSCANRPRQNSVFAGSTCFVDQSLPVRKAKSAMDLLLIQSEENSAEGSPMFLRPSPPQQRMRRTSILPPVPPPLPPLPPPPVLIPVGPPATPTLLRVTNV